jgi:hypothetical protein
LKGQTEQALGIRRGGHAKLPGIVAANHRHLPERIGDPRRLISLPAVRHRREVGRIGLDQQTIARYHPNQIIVCPVLEGHDTAEGHVPVRGDGELRERSCPGIAVQHSDHAGRARLVDAGSGIVLGVAGVDDDRTLRLVSERNLRREGGALGVARRVVVVVVETAFTHRDGTPLEKRAQFRYVAIEVESRRVVGMDPRGREDEACILLGVLSRQRRGIDGLADADDRRRARVAGAGDYRVAVAGERCVREVGVAVDEACRAPVLRGHLRSIQRRTGAAT